MKYIVVILVMIGTKALSQTNLIASNKVFKKTQSSLKLPGLPDTALSRVTKWASDTSLSGAQAAGVWISIFSRNPAISNSLFKDGYNIITSSGKQSGVVVYDVKYNKWRLLILCNKVIDKIDKPKYFFSPKIIKRPLIQKGAF